MSRTHRKEPKGSTSIRHPKTLSERRQLECLINDLPNYDYKISKPNRNSNLNYKPEVRINYVDK